MARGDEDGHLISVRCFESLEEAAGLREEVNALNLLSARPDPFSTFEFYENFLRHDEDFPAGRGTRLWFLAAFSAGRLIGYLALRQVARRALGMNAPTLAFLVTHDNDRPHVVARPESARAVSEAFYAHLLGRPQWSLLELQQQDDTSALFPPPLAVDRRAYRVRQWPSLANCTIDVRWDTLHAYFRALSKKSRSNVSRQMRALLAAGNVELLASSDPGITPALFALYRGIEPHSWKAQAGAGIGRHPERVRYFEGLLDAHQPMRVTIQVLLLDGVPVAGLISGAFANGLYALAVVYDGRVSRLAPGSAMLLLGMRQAIDGRYAFFNLLSGFGYYKARWLATITETRIGQIYRAGSLPFWRRVCGDSIRRVLAAKPGQAPALFNPVRRAMRARTGDETSLGTSAAPQASPEQQARIAELRVAMRSGRGEILSTAELAVCMPFEALRPRAERSPPAAGSER